MNLTYSRCLKPEFQAWVTEHLPLVKEYYAEADHEKYETLEDFAVELYLTIKTEA